MVSGDGSEEMNSEGSISEERKHASGDPRFYNPMEQPIMQPMMQPMMHDVMENVMQPIMQPMMQQNIMEPMAQPMVEPMMQPMGQPMQQPMMQRNAQHAGIRKLRAKATNPGAKRPQVKAAHRQTPPAKVARPPAQNRVPAFMFSKDQYFAPPPAQEEVKVKPRQPQPQAQPQRPALQAQPYRPHNKGPTPAKMAPRASPANPKPPPHLAVKYTPPPPPVVPAIDPYFAL